MARATTVTVIKNLFPAIARKMPVAALAIIGETLEEMDATVKAGMAASGSPSSPGSMPGIDTGALVGSLQHEIDRGKYTGTYYTTNPLAPYLEYGTTKMAPRPFMTPAAERARGPFLRRMKRLEDRLR